MYIRTVAFKSSDVAVYNVTFRPTRRINWSALNSSRAADEAEKWAGIYTPSCVYQL